MFTLAILLIPKMSMFTLAISCLTTSNLPWFMDLHSMFLCNIALYSISLCFYHQSHPQLGVVFALAPSLHSFWSYFSYWSPVAYWAPTDLGISSFIVLSFCLFILLMGFSRKEYWSSLSFFSTMDHTLSELSTMTRPSWVFLHKLHKAVVHVIRLVSSLWLCFSVCLPSDGER